MSPVRLAAAPVQCVHTTVRRLIHTSAAPVQKCIRGCSDFVGLLAWSVVLSVILALGGTIALGAVHLGPGWWISLTHAQGRTGAWEGISPQIRRAGTGGEVGWPPFAAQGMVCLLGSSGHISPNKSPAVAGLALGHWCPSWSLPVDCNNLVPRGLQCFGLTKIFGLSTGKLGRKNLLR